MLFNYLICKEKNKHDKDNEEQLKKIIEFIENQKLIEKNLNDIEKFSLIKTNDKNTILLIQKILYETYFFLHFCYTNIPNSQLKEKKKEFLDKFLILLNEENSKFINEPILIIVLRTITQCFNEKENDNNLIN
jgi:hypothetical protein